METNTITAVSDGSLAEAIRKVTAAKESATYSPEDGVLAIYIAADITLRSPLPVISSNITIEGNGFTISGDDRNRIFEISGGKLSLNNLSLTGGNASTGGTIYHLDGTLNVADCKIYSNNANVGGALFNAIGTCNATNSTFHGNASKSGGGAIFSGYGTLTLQGVSMSNNSASQGGAILSGGEESLTVTNCTFNQNHAENGGAIASVAGQSFEEIVKTLHQWDRDISKRDKGVLALSNCTFDQNKAASNGGAIMVAIGTATIMNTNFFMNEVPKRKWWRIGHLKTW